MLRVDGTIGDELGEFIVAIGKAAQAKHRFHAGMEASGQAVPVPDPQFETVGFYKASGLKILKRRRWLSPGWLSALRSAARPGNLSQPWASALGHPDL